MTTLPDFLLARIAEDEAVARAATPGPWEVGDWWHVQGAKWCRCDAGPLVWSGTRDINGIRMPAHIHRRAEPIGSDVGQADASSGNPVDVSTGNDYGAGVGEHDADHIARHDPARVLAECEAKRRIVTGSAAGASRDTDDWACVAWAVLCDLALPYADHPDFREEWRA